MRACSFVSLGCVVAITVLFAACGGSKPANAPDNPPAPSGTTAGPAPDATTTTTTTTTTLGDGGDLQGAKLATSTTTTVDTTPDAGAKGGGGGGGKKGEPGRTREDIQAIIMSRRDEARACYDEALKRNPNLEGDIDIKWKIDPDGNVTEIGADDSRSTIHDKGVADCISAIIKKIKFAKSNMGKESTMHYPYNFHPKQGQVGNKGAQPAPSKP